MFILPDHGIDIFINGMVDVKSKTCIQPDCKIQPVYNNEGQTKTLYCTKHVFLLKNMKIVNILKPLLQRMF